jgi:hypothetical protein
MDDNTFAASSPSAMINASIEEVGLRSWCFTLPEWEYGRGSSETGGAARGDRMLLIAERGPVGEVETRLWRNPRHLLSSLPFPECIGGMSL